ncbi:MAG: ATPase domain-containing protein [Halanaeroarchaeum sp.]
MSDSVSRVRTGLPGLDRVLNGGLAQGRMYLVHGQPGTGKTILGMHFLETGLENDETVLFVHGEESKDEILTNGAELGIDVSNAKFLDLGPESDFFSEHQSQDLVDPSSIERHRHTGRIHEAIEEVDPDRLVFDPITQLRYFEASEYQFRKRILSFIRFLKERNTTIYATATLADNRAYSTEIQSLSDGIIRLRRGKQGRRLDAVKHRGFGQQDGTHGMEIRDQGIEVFPSLVPESQERSFEIEQYASGIDGLDDLLGGGLERGTISFVTGPTGVGKTTVATKFLANATRAGAKSAMYLFEEGIETLEHRSETVGIPVTELRERGDLIIDAVEPLAMSAEEFAQRVEGQVADNDVDLVLIDGIDGYTLSLQGEEHLLVEKLHALTRHLKNRDVTVVVTDEMSQINGIQYATSSNVSYVADNILFMGYVEGEGTIEKVIGVLKKRASGFERTLREFEITENGIAVGDPLTERTGILGGGPPRERSHSQV